MSKSIKIAMLVASLGFGSACDLMKVTDKRENARALTQGTQGGDPAPAVHAPSYAFLQANVFAPRCLSCHSGAPGQARPDFTSYAKLIQGGTIVAGSPASSSLYLRVSARTMPPGSPLSDDLVALLRAWIQAGAPQGTPPSPNPSPSASPSASPSPMASASPSPSPSASPSPKPSPSPSASPSASPTPIMNANATFMYLQTKVFAPSCLGCHKGSLAPDFSSYATLIASGTREINPGHADMSQVYLRMKAHTMPPGGGISDADIQTVADWINLGAKDAPAPSPSPSASPSPTPSASPSPKPSASPSASPSPAPSPSASPSPMPSATPSLSPTFAALQAQVFAPRCLSCHGPGQYFPDFTSYSSLVTAGSTAVKPGNAAQSQVYLQIQAHAMPLPPLAPLTDAEVKAVGDWINAGAMNSASPSPVPSASPSPSPTMTPSPVPRSMGTGTVGVRDMLQLIPAMGAVTGINTIPVPGGGDPIPEITAYYNANRFELPLTGSVNEINSLSLLAIEGMAALFCDRAINREMAITPAMPGRRLFSGVDFTQTQASFGPGLQRQVIIQLAQSIWKRDPSEAEIQMLMLAVTEANTGQAPSTQMLRTDLLMLCTATLSSSDFLRN